MSWPNCDEKDLSKQWGVRIFHKTNNVQLVHTRCKDKKGRVAQVSHKNEHKSRCAFCGSKVPKDILFAFRLYNLDI
jgi:hypothetical protein